MSRAYSIPIQYGPNGCQVNIDGSQTCRETQTLEIIKEFNRVYESKLHELGSIGGGDNLPAKLHLQQDWIRDLTQQNEMLVRAVEELEKDAADRVCMLEERLENGAQVMQKYKDYFSVYLNETFQKMDYLNNDVRNLVEFIKRVRDNRQWSIDGLQFYTINAPCLLKPCNCFCDCPTSLIQNIPVQDNQPSQPQKQEIVTQDARVLDTKLKEMEKRLSQSPTESDVQELSFKLRLKDEELSSFKRRIGDIETDSTDLRKKFKELEAENTVLKDTIFQANRELEKFYEQANDYLKERDEYKRKFKESTDAFESVQSQFKSEKQALERKVVAQEETIRKMSSEQFLIKEELINTRRQSDSLNQAQNETIQALQEAMRERDQTSEIVRVMPLTSEESWSSTTESTTSRAKTSPIVESRAYNEDEVSVAVSADVAVVQVNADTELCPKDTCSSTCDGFQTLEKVQKERDLERQIHRQEVENLKKTIEELEKGGQQPREQNQLVRTDLTSENSQLRNKVEELECECDAMRRIVNEAKELHQSFIVMQSTKDDLQLEAQHAQKELMRETQLHNINNARIKELQQRLGEKTCEMSQCGELLRNLQNKLCWAVGQNNQLKNEITTLLTHINNYEQNYIYNDERTDICQKEIEVCKDNLTDLKDKLLMMKGLLQQKIDEYSQLENEFCIQNNSLACMKEQICLSEKQYQEEVGDLRCTIEQLQAKLAVTEATCRCLREDYQRSQATVEEYNQIESELQNQFSNRLNDAQNEIIALNNYVSQLKEECCCIKKELKVKEQLIGTAKAQIAHFKSSENAELIAAQDEIDRLRNELNQVFQQHEILKNKNEALCVQLCEVKQTAVGFQHQTELNEHHFHKCLCELEYLQHTKKQLETKNDELRCAYQALCIKYKQVLASVPILNNEIIEYKIKNEDLLSESRNLINNVRAWLENQALINRQVTQKFNDDHLIINNLSKKLVLLEKYKCSSRLHAGSNVDTFEESCPSDASLQTEEVTTQSCTVVDNSDDCSLDNYDFNEPYTKTWLKKVESMTKDLQKSSEYWQSKMSDDYLVTKDQ